MEVLYQFEENDSVSVLVHLYRKPITSFSFSDKINKPMPEPSVDVAELQKEKHVDAAELHQRLLTIVPSANQPAASENIEHLVIAQLAENLDRNDAPKFMTTLSDGTPAYGLPCEFRVINDRYQVFIPRVASWHYIRQLPSHGEHPPLAETYGFNKKDHVFQKRLEELAGIDNLVDYCQNPQNDPPVIGEGASRSSYHRFYWTGNQLVIELQSQPTAGQILGLNELKDRFSAIVPTEIVVKDSQTRTPLPQNKEVFSKLRVPGIISLAYNHNLAESHAAAISPEGTLILDRRPALKKPNIIVGFGYFYTQLDPNRSETAHGSLSDLTIHLDFKARNHEEAKGGFALQRLASHSLAKRQEKEHFKYSQLGTTIVHTR